MIRIQTNAEHGSVSTKQQMELAADRYAFVSEDMGTTPEFKEEVLN